MTVCDKLKRCPLFAGIEDVWTYLDCGQCIPGRYQKNTLVAREGDACNGIAVLTDGEITVRQLMENGEELVVGRLSAGDAFGMGVLFAEKPRIPYTLLALRPTEVIYVPREQVEALLDQSAEFRRRYLRRLSDGVLWMKDRLHLLFLRDARSRILFYLSLQANYYQSLSFPLRMSVTELAGAVGMARPTVSRELSRLQAERVVSLSSRNAVILQPELFSLMFER